MVAVAHSVLHHGSAVANSLLPYGSTVARSVLPHDRTMAHYVLPHRSTIAHFVLPHMEHDSRQSYHAVKLSAQTIIICWPCIYCTCKVCVFDCLIFFVQLILGYLLRLLRICVILALKSAFFCCKFVLHFTHTEKRIV